MSGLSIGYFFLLGYSYASVKDTVSMLFCKVLLDIPGISSFTEQVFPLAHAMNQTFF